MNFLRWLPLIIFAILCFVWLIFARRFRLGGAFWVELVTLLGAVALVASGLALAFAYFRAR